MVNHAAAGLKTLNESEFQGRGISHIFSGKVEQLGLLRQVRTFDALVAIDRREGAARKEGNILVRPFELDGAR